MSSTDDNVADRAKSVDDQVSWGERPRVFVSYSWTSQEHQDRVRGWVDRLLADGVDTIFDVYDLKEGSDKYAFMEQMVTDASVTHVLVFSDGEYARKADSRDAGVGVESQRY